MRIALINSVEKGSTGKIACQIAEYANLLGEDARVFVPSGRHNSGQKSVVKQFGSRISEDSHLLLTRLTGFNGCFSILATCDLLRQLDEFDPDILHLHNLHNSYVNLPMLFSYIKKNNKKVVWTLHDCWAFTGQCPHFTISKCQKWITGCNNCDRFRKYPQSFVDRTKTMWRLKKKWFTDVNEMVLVTPSKWLAEEAKLSYLHNYPIKVINNGIDLTVFYPRTSNIRETLGINNDVFVILGVAFGWGYSKGLDVFTRLSESLDPTKYKIVLVGTDEKTDRVIPETIVSIHRTDNQSQLADLYSAADVLLNPTREDTYPTVNMEAIACGTPVLTFNTGGSPEMVSASTGIIVDSDDYQDLIEKLQKIKRSKQFNRDEVATCAGCFDKNNKIKEYIDLYENLTYCS